MCQFSQDFVASGGYSGFLKNCERTLADSYSLHGAISTATQISKAHQMVVVYTFPQIFLGLLVSLPFLNKLLSGFYINHGRLWPVIPYRKRKTSTHRYRCGKRESSSPDLPRNFSLDYERVYFGDHKFFKGKPRCCDLLSINNLFAGSPFILLPKGVLRVLLTNRRDVQLASYRLAQADRSQC